MNYNNLISFCTQHELSLRGYQKHVSSQKAPAPLTNAEEELEEIKKNEVYIFLHIGYKTIFS